MILNKETKELLNNYINTIQNYLKLNYDEFIFI